MDLQEVRGRINQLDEELKSLYDERLLCSKKVAYVKLATKDEVYKPKREKEIYARYSDDTLGENHKAFVRRIVQLSRKYQYSVFKEENEIDENYYSWLGVDNLKTLEQGGELIISLNSDEGQEKGLDIKNILEIASCTSLTLSKVNADSAIGKVNISYIVLNDLRSREEAFLLSYMLYKETIK